MSYPLIKDDYGLTVSEIQDFVSSLAEKYDHLLYNWYSKIRLLDNYGDTIQFCPSCRVNVPMKFAFHQVLAWEILQQRWEKWVLLSFCTFEHLVLQYLIEVTDCSFRIINGLLYVCSTLFGANVVTMRQVIVITHNQRTHHFSF